MRHDQFLHIDPPTRRHDAFAWRVAGAAVLSAVLVFAAGCGSDDSAGADPTSTTDRSGHAPAAFAITTDGASYSMPAEVASGYVSISLTNESDGAAMAQVMALRNGVTVDNFRAALLSDPTGAAAFSKGDFVGGVTGVGPGATFAATTALTPGLHVVLDVAPDANGIPGFVAGRFGSFTVTDAGHAHDAPEADDVVTLHDFHYGEVNTWKAGETIELDNNGNAPHELALMKLAAGKTARDALMFLVPTPGEPPVAGPPPFTTAGGAAAISAGASAYIELPSEPGDYVIVCFVPDPTQGGAPHVALGMAAPVTLTA